jgi:cytochrome c-type biogenesis protein
VIGTLFFATLAGGLSILSPCVLPILPVILAAAVGQSRFGPLALAAGLAISFAVTGLALATIGYAAGIDAGPVRAVGAVVMIAFGAVLAVPQLQAAMAVALGPLGSRGADFMAGRAFAGAGGQFGLGLVLGLVWSPCVGPTLGAASIMAARGENLTQVGLTMAAFGIGAGLPLAAFGLLPRERLAAARTWIGAAGQTGKTVLGLLLLVAGVLVLTGIDKWVETQFVERMPDWLVELTTKF